MSEQNIFKIKKNIPTNLFFTLTPYSAEGISSLNRQIYLTYRMPEAALPMDWALGIFINPSLYKMYKEGIFTFDNNEALLKAAIEKGLIFEEELSQFNIKQVNKEEEILKIIKKGNRKEILKIIEDEGRDMVISVVSLNIDTLQYAIVQMLESILGVQLTIDGSRE